MYKILIIDEKSGNVVLDTKTKNVLLSALDETGEGVKSFSANDAKVQEVAMVLAGANATVKSVMRDHPHLHELTRFFSMIQSTEEVMKGHG